MDQLERLGPAQLRAVVTAYRDALRAHQEPVNRLNVYPVPDGDTGTNMALTLESVVSALDGGDTRAQDDPPAHDDMAATSKAICRGSLMGARGNSGVILSQVLRGFCEVCAGAEEVGAEDLARALRAASKAADGAVAKPVEGTILTVVRGAAEGAEEAASQGRALAEVLGTARSAAAEALERTPELLPVLARAGVVDAGGLGYLLFIDALLHVATGCPLPEPEAVPAGPVSAAPAPAPAGRAEEPDEVGEHGFEVMFLLEAPDDAIPSFQEAWSAIGDSIVVAGGDGLWNCHIHTADIGGAIEAAVERGRPRDIRVTDLRQQVEEERWVREAAAPATATPAEVDERTVTTAVVAVASGDGVSRLFRSLGVQAVVPGGQSMNPSTSEILEAVEAVDAEEVVVLPNNDNVVPVAEQVDAFSPKRVRVVRTGAVAEGLAALLQYEPEVPADQNVEAMAEAAADVGWGEVTQAVRASSSEAGPIREGDWLGLSRAGIQVVAQSPVEAVTGLLDKLVDAGHEVVTLLEGEGASEAGTRRISEWLAAHRPGVELEVHAGGQPFYPYLISVE